MNSANKIIISLMAIGIIIAIFVNVGIMAGLFLLSLIINVIIYFAFLRNKNIINIINNNIIEYSNYLLSFIEGSKHIKDLNIYVGDPNINKLLDDSKVMYVISYRISKFLEFCRDKMYEDIEYYTIYEDNPYDTIDEYYEETMKKILEEEGESEEEEDGQR